MILGQKDIMVLEWEPIKHSISEANPKWGYWFSLFQAIGQKDIIILAWRTVRSIISEQTGEFRLWRTVYQANGWHELVLLNHIAQMDEATPARAEPDELAQVQPQARVDGGLLVGAKVARRDGTHTPLCLSHWSKRLT
jgi:hypothetical protein